MRRMWILKGIGMMCFAIAIVLLVGFVVQSLWNGIMSPVFSLPVLSLAQATGLFLLAKILTGGLFRPFGFGGGYRQGWKGNWKRRWEEKWEKMSVEDREKLKQMYRGKCGHSRQRAEAFRTEKEEAL